MDGACGPATASTAPAAPHADCPCSTDRIRADVSIERVFGMVKKMQIKRLGTLDQLNIERAAGRVFQGFSEPPLNFLPT